MTFPANLQKTCRMVGMNGLSNGQPREKTPTKIQVKIAQLILSPLQKTGRFPFARNLPVVIIVQQELLSVGEYRFWHEAICRGGDFFNHTFWHFLKNALFYEFVHIGLKLVVGSLREDAPSVAVVANVHGNLAEVTPAFEEREEVVAREAACLADVVEHERHRVGAA